MKTLLQLASPIKTSIEPEDTVQRAVQVLFDCSIGAVPVLNGNKLAGIFSERDLLRRVIAKKLNPDTTKVSDVMTTQVKTMLDTEPVDRAFFLMHQGKFRNLPIVDKTGKILGMLSILDLLEYRIHELDEETKTLAAYITADGSGG